MSNNNACPAYVEDAAEDTGSSLEGDEGTRKYAVSDAPPTSSSQEQSHTKKSRVKDGRKEERPKAGRAASSSSLLSPTDTDFSSKSSKPKAVRISASHKDSDREQREREKRKEAKSRREGREARAQQPETGRPGNDPNTPRRIRPGPPSHAATQPIIQQTSSYAKQHYDDPAFYGVQEPGIPAGGRPAARARPASFYAGQSTRPPITTNSWQQHHPAPFPVGTFPPPMIPSPSPMMHAPMPPPGPSPMEPRGYFDPNFEHDIQSHERLKQRFSRPASAMGGGPPSSAHMRNDFENSGAPALARRLSRSGRPDQERDRREMPPPTWIRRPSSAMPSTPFRPPPPPQVPQPSPNRQQRPPNFNRRSGGIPDQGYYGFGYGFDDDELAIRDDELFNDMSPQPPYEPSRGARSQPRRGSVAYEHVDYDLVPANGRSSKRSSMYGSGGASLEEDNIDAALRYQERVNGGKVPLTEKTLREVSKRAGVPSSRSTRSSGSRDESDYKRSHTTGFTRSSSGGGPDDYTIKVSGPALVRASGVEIECNGGQITFSGPSRSRSGSERESTVFPQIEDSHSRLDRQALPYRQRAPSQADSHSRAYAPYNPGLRADIYD